MTTNSGKPVRLPQSSNDWLKVSVSQSVNQIELIGNVLKVFGVALK